MVTILGSAHPTFGSPNPFVALLRANGLAADQNGQGGPCGFGAAPIRPMVLLGLVSLKLCSTRRMGRC